MKSGETRIAEIEEVSTNGECRQNSAIVGPRGFEDDRSGTPGIILINGYVIHHINRNLGLQLMAGQLGENIWVKGARNLSALPSGTLIRINKKVVLMVEAKAGHYREMFPKFPDQVLNLLERRGGAVCSVVSGIGERVGEHQDVEFLDAQKG